MPVINIFLKARKRIWSSSWRVNVSSLTVFSVKAMEKWSFDLGRFVLTKLTESTTLFEFLIEYFQQMDLSVIELGDDQGHESMVT